MAEEERTVREMVEDLPKPETLEEQYLYALVCSVAEVTPKYGVSQQAAFKRMEQYWKTFYLVAAAKFTALETPKKDSVYTIAIRDNAVTTGKVEDKAVTLGKLEDDVAARLWAVNRSKTVVTAYLADKAVTTDKINDASVTEDKLADNSVTTDKVEDGAITSAKIANGTIQLEDLDPTIQSKLNSIILNIL